MKFELIKYKKHFIFFRRIIKLIILIIIIDVFFIKYFIKKENSFYYLIAGFLLIIYKYYYYFKKYYDVVGTIEVEKNLVKINGTILEEEISIYYFGFYKMERWVYIPFIFILFFYWPKSKKAPIYDGINILKVKNIKYYFISKSKDDYLNIKSLSKSSKNLKVIKCFL